MTHNDEEDRYRNNTIVANYGRKFSDKIKFESNLRVAETYSQYDKEVDTSTADHSEELDALQSSANISLVYEPNSQFTNKLTLSNAYIERIAAETPSSGNTAQDNYFGTRYGFMYSGNYNFNLNSRVMSFGENKLKLTEKEINSILYLFKIEKEVKIQELQTEVWGYQSQLETHTVETHIYRLRKKNSKTFNDQDFIISKKNGYKIKKEK